MKLFKKRKNTQSADITEEKFQQIITLVKDLPRADYNRLKSGMDLAYEGYQKIRNVKTIDEKATEGIDDVEKTIDFMEEK